MNFLEYNSNVGRRIGIFKIFQTQLYYFNRKIEKPYDPQRLPIAISWGGHSLEGLKILTRYHGIWACVMYSNVIGL